MALQRGLSHPMESARVNPQEQVSRGSAGGSTSREYNPVLLCHIGQDAVQEIVAKMTEIFSVLHSLQLVQLQPQRDTKLKLQDLLKETSIMMQKVRVIHRKVKEEVEARTAASADKFIPYEDEECTAPLDVRVERVTAKAEEHRDSVTKLRARTGQLAEIIELMRNTVWDLNAMLQADSAQLG